VRRPGAYGFFPRPRLYRAGWYHGAVYARPAYYPYSHGVSHGYRWAGSAYPAYPVTSFGTVAGAGLSAPLYNRPGLPCY
jgi:hypothetical protein